MYWNKTLQDHSYAVLGAGRSGVWCALLLKQYGAQVCLIEKGALSAQAAVQLQSQRIPYQENSPQDEACLEGISVLVISPGIPLHTPFVWEAQQRGMWVISEIEVASWFLPPNACVLAVTGSNGKTTTTHYLASLLATQGTSIACGNIGVSLSQALCELPPLDPSERVYLCLELSSYQLETTYSLRPQASCLLNLKPDHLARYGGLSEYLKAKWRLVMMTDPTGMVILENGALELAVQQGLPLPPCRVVVVDTQHVPYSPPQKPLWELPVGRFLPLMTYQNLKHLPLRGRLPAGAIQYVHVCQEGDQGSLVVEVQNAPEASYRIQTPCLPGLHNAVNVLVASTLAQSVGCPQEAIQQHWETLTTGYKPLPHRIEVLHGGPWSYRDAGHTVKSLTLINDSKATNVDSVMAALQALRAPVRLLLGGEAKGDSYEPLLRYAHVLKIYPFGQAAPVIRKELVLLAADRLAPSSSTLEQAAESALQDAQNGDVILLSPGGSSFDEFQNYEHRGAFFCRWALSRALTVHPHDLCNKGS